MKKSEKWANLKKIRSHLSIIARQVDELKYLDNDIYTTFLREDGKSIADVWLDKVKKTIEEVVE